MDEVAVLTAQLEALLQQLGRAQQALDAEHIDADLRQRVHVRFDTLISKQQRALRDLQVGPQSEGLRTAWITLKGIRRECNRLFSEILAFLQGALVRSAGLDGGICQIADDLLEDLRRRTDIAWSRLTIPGETAFFAQMAEIIRVPYPEFSIWNLPLTAHEFGHLVAQELRVRQGDSYVYLFQDLLDREGRGGQTERFLHEYFADIFATYAHGPAYLCLAAVLRFDPVTAHVDGRDHPSAMKRVRVMLATLAMMDDGVAVPSYGYIRRLVGDLWDRGIAAAGRLERTATVDQVGDEQRWATEIYRLLERELPGAKYGGWARARRLVRNLEPYGGLPSVQEGDTLPDVLNAGWLWRLEREERTGEVYEAQRIDQTLRGLCRLIVAGEGGSHA